MKRWQIWVCAGAAVLAVLLALGALLPEPDAEVEVSSQGPITSVTAGTAGNVEDVAPIVPPTTAPSYAANIPAVTSEEFAQVYVGMPYAEVVRIFGWEGTLSLSMTIGDVLHESRTWENNYPGQEWASVSLGFENGAVSSVVQFGLD